MAVNVRFGANTQDLEAGVNRAKSALSAFTAPVRELGGAMEELGSGVESAAGKIGSGFESLVGSLGPAFAKLAGESKEFLTTLAHMQQGFPLIGGIVNWIHGVDTELSQLKTNARETGLSLEDFQKLQYAANLERHVQRGLCRADAPACGQARGAGARRGRSGQVPRRQRHQMA